MLISYPVLNGKFWASKACSQSKSQDANSPVPCKRSIRITVSRENKLIGLVRSILMCNQSFMQNQCTVNHTVLHSQRVFASLSMLLALCRVVGRMFLVFYWFALPMKPAFVLMTCICVFLGTEAVEELFQIAKSTDRTRSNLLPRSLWKNHEKTRPEAQCLQATGTAGSFFTPWDQDEPIKSVESDFRDYM